mmetsp:Transcript_50208/g.92851  ORF Transcript_50208/g.92851 Transcript_50208/m.92851 type:complete len:101 (+) Transcript_50208:429-731(+)
MSNASASMSSEVISGTIGPTKSRISVKVLGHPQSFGDVLVQVGSIGIVQCSRCPFLEDAQFLLDIASPCFCFILIVAAFGAECVSQCSLKNGTGVIVVEV